MTEACGAGNIEWYLVCVRTRICSKSLDTHKFLKHAKIVLDVVSYDSNVGVYCERYEMS